MFGRWQPLMRVSMAPEWLWLQIKLAGLLPLRSTGREHRELNNSVTSPSCLFLFCTFAKNAFAYLSFRIGSHLLPRVSRAQEFVLVVVLSITSPFISETCHSHTPCSCPHRVPHSLISTPAHRPALSPIVISQIIECM